MKIKFYLTVVKWLDGTYHTKLFNCSNLPPNFRMSIPTESERIFDLSSICFSRLKKRARSKAQKMGIEVEGLDWPTKETLLMVGFLFISKLIPIPYYLFLYLLYISQVRKATLSRHN